MTKNICTIDAVAPVQGSVFEKAVGLAQKIWSGTDPADRPAASTPQLARRPGPVLYRLPDLRKFGPNFV